MKLLDERGVTLLELMIAISVSTIIAYVLFVARRTAQTQMDTTNVSMSIQTSAREGLYRMLQEIRESAASRITLGSGGSSITFNVPDPSSPVTAGYAVNWPGHQIQYARGGTNNSQVIRTNSTTGQTSVIANDVTGLTFTGTGGNSVISVSMNVQRNLLNGRSIPATALVLSGQAKVRNT